MKKFISILFAAAVAALAVISCQTEQETYEPGTPDREDCYGVYFPVQDASGSHTYDPDMDRSVSITVKRTNTAGAITVPYSTATSDEGVFNFGEITFAEGQSETTLEVTFPKAEEGKELSFSVQLPDDNLYVSHYNSGAIALDFSVLIVQWQDFLNPKTEEPAVITINEGWWNEVHMGKIRYYEVNGVRTAVLSSIEEGNGIWGDSVDATLQFTWYLNENNEAGYNYLEVPKQYFGFDYDDWESKPVGDATSPIYVYDYYWYWIERGYSPEELDGDWLGFAKTEGQSDGSGGYPVGYYDGNGGFYFNLRYYIPGLGGFSPDTYDFVAIADGFVRVDYSLKLKTDYTQDGVTPIYVEAGPDVSFLKYAVYEGELNSAQMAAKIEAIIAGEEKAETFSGFVLDEEDNINYGTFGIAPEKTGEYTVVVVAYSKDKEAQNEGSVVCSHIAASDTADYAVEVSVFTEDTPERYTTLHAYDSFAYGISGTDLVDIHVGVIPASDIESYGAEVVLAAVKTGASYAVGSDAVEEANADGGYYNVATGLKGKTEYVVVVWATNGDLDTFVTDTYTTEPLPYVWNSIGKGTLTDGFLMPLFGMDDVTVACDVYEEEITPGLYMITGFQLELGALFQEVDEEVLADYEDEYWYNAEIIVDATDPEAVYIGEQDYGLYVNSTYGWVMIDSEPTGTLVDGVITFPVREMYVGLTNAGWYYGNSYGTFAITLPESASGASLTAKPEGKSISGNFLLSNARAWEKPVQKFERDPQSISVKIVNLAPARKAKVSGRYTDLVKF